MLGFKHAVQCSVTQASRLTIGLHRFSILDNGQTLQFLTSVQGLHTLNNRLVISGSTAKENMLYVRKHHLRHICVIILQSVLHYYQPAVCFACSQLVLRLLCVCLYICASTLITWAIITSCILFPCNLTS